MRLVRPRFAFHWIIAASGTLAAWPLAIVAGLELPQIIPLSTWQPENLFPTSPTLLVDRFSWAYALALTTLVLAVMLTDVVRAAEADWKDWTSCLVLTAIGIFAVMAGNPLTLLLAWMAIDVVELLVVLSKVKKSALREWVIVAFSARTFGSLLVILAAILAAAQGQALTFSNLLVEANGVLLLAAGFRLGVLPLHIPLLQSLPLKRGLGTISRVVPVAATLILLARIAANQHISSLIPVFLGFAALAAIYSGVTWLLARDELDGRPAWFVGMASLSLAAAVQGQAMASLSWGLSGILGGGLLFLFSTRNKWLVWFPLVGMIAIIGLPFTPNWNGAQLFSGRFNLLLLPLFVAHALLLVGFTRHVLRSEPNLNGVEKWIWFIYPLGLSSLLVTLFTLGYWMSPPSQIVPIQGWFTGLASLGLAGLLVALGRRWKNTSPGWVVVLQSLLSLNWLYRIIWGIYRLISRLLGTFTKLLEGEGGVLWALLLLGLIFSLLSRLN